jgi:hypothetical protein
MIEIITEPVEMPTEVSQRRFKKMFVNNRWKVLDCIEKKIVYIGKFEDVALACHNLNKKHYQK